MLDGDDLPAAQRASETFRDRPIPQFWDGDLKLGRELARSMGAEGWTAWDIYVFYPKGAEWTDQGLPPASAVLAQAGGVVVATKGSLPAVNTEVHLPKQLRDRVDVVGTQDDLEALLSRVAVPIARR